jgi:hypothetical protein
MKMIGERVLLSAFWEKAADAWQNVNRRNRIERMKKSLIRRIRKSIKSGVRTANSYCQNIFAVGFNQRKGMHRPLCYAKRGRSTIQHLCI